MTGRNNESPPSRVRTFLRKFRKTVFLGFVLVVLLLALVAWLNREKVSHAIQDSLTRKVEQLTGGTLSLGEFELGILPFSMRLEHIHLEIPTDHGNGFDLKIRSVHATATALDVLRYSTGRISLSSLDLVGPELRFDRSFFKGGDQNSSAMMPLAFKISQLKVDDGWVRYEGHDLPLSIDVHGLELVAAWNGGRDSLVGTIRFGTNLAGGPFPDGFPVTLAANFDQRGNGLALQTVDLHFQGGATQFDEVLISWDDQLRISGHGDFQSDLGEFHSTLAPDMPLLRGTVRGDVRLLLAEGDLAVHSSLTGERVQVGPVQTETVQADGSFNLERMTLTNLQASAFDGTVVGELQVPWDMSRQLTLDLRGEQLDSRVLFELLELPLPVSASTDVEMIFTGVWSDRTTWQSSGVTTLTGKEPVSDSLTAEGSATFNIDSGFLTVEAPAVGMAGAEFRLLLEHDLANRVESPEGTIRLSGITRDSSATQEAVLTIMEMMEAPPPEILQTVLSGAGRLETKIGLGEGVDLDLNLALDDGAWGGDRFNLLEFQLELRDNLLGVHDIKVIGDTWDLSGNLDADIDAGVLKTVEISSSGFPLQRALVLAGIDLEAEGGISANLDLTSDSLGLGGQGEFSITNTSLAGLSIGELQGRFLAVGGLLSSTDLRLTGPGLDVTGMMSLDTVRGTTEVRIDRGAIDPSGSSIWPQSLEGSSLAMLVTGVLSFEGESLEGTLLVEGYEWSLGGQDLPSTRTTLVFDPSGVHGHTLSKEGEFLKGEFEIGFGADLPLRGHFDFMRFPFHGAQNTAFSSAGGWLSGFMDMSGQLGGEFAFAASGRLDQLGVRFGSHRLTLAEPAELRINSESVVIDPVHFTGQDSELRAGVKVDLVNGRLDITCSGKVDLAALAAPFPELRAHGHVDVDIRVDGAIHSPRLWGSANIRNGWVRLLGFPQPFQEIVGTIHFQGDELHLTDLRSRFGGGEIAGEGGLRFDHFLPEAYYLDLSCTRISVPYPEGFRGVYDGVVHLRGDSEEALVDGNLDLSRGLYDEPFDLARLLGYGVREYDAGETFLLPVPVMVNLDLAAEQDLWLKNDLAELEASLHLNVGGAILAPEITGRIQILEGGIIRFRDNEYRVRSGSLELLNLDKIDPYIDITASTSIEQYEIILRMEGTLERFEYSLTSNPPLSQQDILALLTTGYTLDDLASNTGNSRLGLSGDLAASYFAGALTGLFENQLKKAFHLEKIKISPYTHSGTADPTTQLTLGKEVADKLYIIYSTSLGGDDRDIYTIDWQATRKFHLTAESDSDSGVGGGIEYADQFWLRPRKKLKDSIITAPVLPGEIPQGARVSEIQIDGIDEACLSRVRKSIPLQHNTPYRRSLLFEGEENIRRSLVLEGHIHAEVNSTARYIVSENDVFVTYDVNPGSVWDVQFEGVSSGEGEKLLKLLQKSWIDSVFIDESFEDAMLLLRNHFQGKGHYVVDLEMERVASPGESHKNQAVLFRIDPGPKVAVRSLRLEGNTAIDDERITQQVLTSRGSGFGKQLLVPEVLERDLGAIRNLYRDQGYLQVQTLKPGISLDITGSHADILVSLVEGPKFSISRTEYTGDSSFSDVRLREWAALEDGALFSPRIQQDAESGLRSGLDGAGYPDARVHSVAVLEEDTVQVRFEISQRQHMTVGRFRLEGNLRTQDKILHRELALKTGDPVSREKVLESQHNLYRLGIFSSVKITYDAEPGGDPGIRTLVVKVEEAAPFRLRVGTGFSSEDGLRGSLRLAHENVGGYDRTIAFYGRISNIERWAQILMEEPRLFTRKWPALISILNERREEIGYSFRRRSAAFRIEHEFRKNWKRFLRYNFQRVDLFDILEGSEELIREQKLEDLILGDLGIAVVRDSRDDPFLTRSGSYFSGELQLFAPVFLSEETFSKMFLRGTWSRTFKSGGTFASSIRVGLAQPYGDTERVPLSERYFAGGDLSHRGFGRDELGAKDINGVPIGGQSLLLLNQEWRQTIWGPLRGVLFYDAGNVYRTLGDLDPFEIRHAVGAGLQLETPIGPIRAEYGRKLDRREGETGGEFFLSIGQIF
jgi:outer membrane protein insertion porin family